MSRNRRAASLEDALNLITGWDDSIAITPDADPTPIVWGDGNAAPCSGWQVAVTGTVKVKMISGREETWYCLAGLDYARQATHVFQTGTSAEGIVFGR